MKILILFICVVIATAAARFSAREARLRTDAALIDREPIERLVERVSRAVREMVEIEKSCLDVDMRDVDDLPTHDACSVWHSDIILTSDPPQYPKCPYDTSNVLPARVLAEKLLQELGYSNIEFRSYREGEHWHTGAPHHVVHVCW